MSLLMKRQAWSLAIRPLGFRPHSHPTSQSWGLVIRIFLRGAPGSGLGVARGITALSSLMLRSMPLLFHTLRHFRPLALWMRYSGHRVRQMHLKLRWSATGLNDGAQAVGGHQSSSMARVKNPSLPWTF